MFKTLAITLLLFLSAARADQDGLTPVNIGTTIASNPLWTGVSAYDDAHKAEAADAKVKRADAEYVGVTPGLAGTLASINAATAGHHGRRNSLNKTSSPGVPPPCTTGGRYVPELARNFRSTVKGSLSAVL